MTVSFVGAAGRFKKGSDEDARHGGGGNPDDQSYRHHIGDPKDTQGDDDPYSAWKKSGHISRREFDRDVMGDLRRAGMSARKRAMVEVVGEGFKDKDHGVSGLKRAEVIELVDEIKERANRLGLNKGDIGKIERAVGDAVNE